MASILITYEGIYKYDHKRTIEEGTHNLMVTLQFWALVFYV